MPSSRSTFRSARVPTRGLADNCCGRGLQARWLGSRSIEGSDPSKQSLQSPLSPPPPAINCSEQPRRAQGPPACPCVNTTQLARGPRRARRANSQRASTMFNSIDRPRPGKAGSNGLPPSTPLCLERNCIDGGGSIGLISDACVRSSKSIDRSIV